MLSEGIESDQWHEMGYDGAPESPFFWNVGNIFVAKSLVNRLNFIKETKYEWFLSKTWYLFLQ